MKETMKLRVLNYLKDFLDGKLEPKELVKNTVEDICDELNSSYQFNTLDKGTVIRVIVSVLRSISFNMSMLRIIAPGVSLSQKRDPWTPSQPSVITTPAGEKSKPHTEPKPEHEKLRTLKEYQDFYKGTEWEKEFNDMTENDFNDYIGKQAAKYEGPKTPQHAPGEKDIGDTAPKHLKTLVDVGPWRARSHGYDLVLSGTVRKQLDQVQAIKSKVDELHREIERVTDSTVDQIYPKGLLDSIEQLNKELKKGLNKPTSNPEEEAGEKGKLQKEREQRKAEIILFDFPTQMSTNIASKFIGSELPDNEFDAVVS
jgi:hypothetical protein